MIAASGGHWQSAFIAGAADTVRSMEASIEHGGRVLATMREWARMQVT